MKTIKEWLEELPEPIIRQALNNLDPKDAVILVPSMEQAIIKGLYCDETEQGYGCWSSMYDWHIEHSFQDQLLSKLNTFNPKRHTTKQVIEELTEWAKQLK